ncbi:phosphatidylserine decarboxylase family protein [Candidatus Amoebophilus asiaticus]|nr:phosphatidylserine decarboxylase family protein [Candidatus Amoebophilus asiaticus]
MRIHKEGIATLLWVGSLLFVLNLLFLIFSESFSFLQLSVVTISLLFFVILFRFFRDPVRNISPSDKQIFAPADGSIVAIEEVDETEYFKDKRTQISIFMSPFDVHINRSPISGKVKYFRYYPGKYFMAFHPKSSIHNERTSIVFENGNKFEILIRQIAGFLARRIVYYVKEGDDINQGDQFGFIKFGSRVDLLLPTDLRITVKLNEKVIGGKSVIAELV